MQPRIILSNQKPDQAIAKEVLGNKDDVLLFTYENLKIEEARELRTLCLESSHKTLVIYFENGTIPAQNALLKALEEYHPNVEIYLMVPRLEILLSTIISRCVVEKTKQQADFSEIKSFTRMNHEERLTFIKKDWGGNTTSFLDLLISYLSQDSQKNIDILFELEKTRELSLKNLASPGHIVEHVALVLKEPNHYA